MSTCTYRVGGKSLTQEQVEQQINQIGIANYKLAHLSQEMITVEQAKSIVKSWLPNAKIEGPGAWLKIMPTLFNSQLQDPTQNLMAKISDGAIIIESDSQGQLSKRMLTHEVVHLLYKYGMSPAWKARFNKALENEYGQSLNELTEPQVEHLMARVYESTSKPASTSLGRFVDMIKSLVKFFVLNKKDLKTLGELLMSGYFSRSVSNIEVDYKANYSIIDKYFKNLNAYKAAKSYLMSSMYQLMKEGKNGLPVTREDAIRLIRADLGSAKNRIQAKLDKAAEKRDEYVQKLNTLTLEGKLTKYQRIKLTTYIANEIDEYNRQEAAIIGLNVLTNKPERYSESPIVVQLLKEIFPTWSLDQSTINTVIELFESEKREFLEDEEIYTSDGLRNETLVTEREIEQDKTSTSVKDFLAFIPVEREENQAPDEFAVDNFIPYGWAFAKMTKFFTEFIELFNTNLNDLNEMFKYIKSNRTIDNWTSSTLNHLHELFIRAINYPNNVTKSVTVREYQDPFTKSTSYFAFTAKNPNMDISSLSTNELVQRRNDKGAPWNTYSVSATKGINNSIMEQLYKEVIDGGSNISKEHFTAIYEFYRAVDTLNELHNHLGSLDERDYYIGIIDWYKGKFQGSYVSATGTDVKGDIRSQLESAVVSAVMEKTLKVLLSNAETKKKVNFNVSFANELELHQFIENVLRLPYLVVNLKVSKNDLGTITTNFNAIFNSMPPTTRMKPEDIEEALNIWVADNKTRFTSIASIFAKDSKDLVPGSLIDSSGNRLNKNTVSSFGIKLINLLHSVKNISHPNRDLANKHEWKGGTGNLKYKASSLPDFIWTPLYRLNLIVQGINTLNTRVTLHDATKNPFLDKVWVFTRETTKLWWTRNFVFGFLDSLNSDKESAKHAGRKDKYMQFFYQPSDKSRISMVGMDVLKEDELKKGISLTLQKLHHLQNVEGRTLQYVNTRFYKPDFNPYMTDFLAATKGTPKYNQLLVLAQTHVYEKVLAHAYEIYDTKIKNIKIPIFDNIKDIYEAALGGPLSKTIDPVSGEDVTQTTPVRELFALWYLNNMVNGYHLNELVSGNPEYYSKKAIDIVKRQAGVWGPQIKPRVGINGSSEKFRVWALQDTVIPRDSKTNDPEEQSIYSFLMNIYSGRRIPKERIDQEVSDLLDLFEKEGFKMTDGGGLMHPSRWADLSKGFGSSYRLGAVMKPMHFQIKTKWEIAKEFTSKEEAERFLKENPGDYFGNNKWSSTYDDASTLEVVNEETEESTTIYPVYRVTAFPVYMKYATMVLSDHFLGVTRLQPQGKYPALFALRQMMEAPENLDSNGMPIGEVVYSSVLKLGSPPKQALSTTGQILTQMAQGESTQLTSFAIPAAQIIELDNRFYGFQFNPTTKALKNVSHPTQLEYLANLLEDNNKEAAVIYGSLALINEIGLVQFKRKLSKFKDLTAYLRSLLATPDTERIQHLLEAGASINMPTIQTKAIIQTITAVTKSVIDIKSRGGKLVMQGVDGITNPAFTKDDLTAIANKFSSSEFLKYDAQDEMSVAEAIIPRDMLTPEQRAIVDNGGTVLLLGFRIPSTEIHSSIALKVKGYYDKTGTNVIIVPKEVLPIQGADLDVDSLFVLAPEIILKDTVINGITFEENTPVGKVPVYTKDGIRILRYDDAYQVWSDAIKAELLVTKNAWEIEALEKLQMKLAKNHMLDSFISIATSTKNLKRMQSPISKEEFQRDGEVNGEKSGLKELAERGLIDYNKDASNPFESDWDLTLAEESAESHESIKDGTQLTGVFANNVKVLSILAKAALMKGTTIAPKFVTRWKTRAGNIERLDRIRDYNFRLKSSLTWQSLDALINLAIDNAKDQVLGKFKINSKNANLVSMLFASGVTASEFALITGTQMWRRASSDEFTNFDSGLSKLAEETYGKDLFKKLRIAKNEDAASEELNSTEELDKISPVILSHKVLSDFLKIEAIDKEKRTEKQNEQYRKTSIAILDLLYSNYKLGQYVKTMSEVLTVLRDVNPDMGELEVLYNKIIRVFGLKSLELSGFTEEEVTDELELVEDTLELVTVLPALADETVPPAPKKAKVKPSLSENYKPDLTDTEDFINNQASRLPELTSKAAHSVFDIRSIFKINPHIYSALRSVEYTYKLIKENFLIHSKALDLFASADVGIKLHRETIRHRTLVKEEFSKFLLTNTFTDKFLKDLTTYKGIKVWTEKFIEDIDSLRQADKRYAANPDYRLLGYKPNKFLNHVTVVSSLSKTSTGRKNISKTLKVHSGLQMTPADVHEMVQGFKDLTRFRKLEDGTWGYQSDITPAFTLDSTNEIQQSLLLFNILTSGLSYGSSNYSIFIPPQIYSELQKEFEQNLVEIVKGYKGINEESRSGLLYSFYLKVAAENLKRIGRIKVEKDEKDPDVFTSKLKLIQNKKEKDKDNEEIDFSVNRGVHIEDDGTPVFYDLGYSINPDYTAKATTIDTTLKVENNLIEVEDKEENDFDKDPSADMKESEALKEVVVPIFLRKSSSLYLRSKVLKDKFFFQRVGDEKSVPTSIVSAPSQYDMDYYFHPNYRTLLVEDIEQNTHNRSQIDLSYDLETKRPIRLADVSNLYRTIERWVVVDSYNEKTEKYTFIDAAAPIQRKPIKAPIVEEQTEEEKATTQVAPPVKANPKVSFAPLSGAGPSTTLQTIKEEGAKWVDKPEFVEHEGQIVRDYEHPQKGTVTRLTDGVKGAFNTLFKRRPFTLLRMQYIHKQADNLWEDKDPTEKQLFADLAPKPLNKAEYISQVKANTTKWTNIGTAGHKLLEAFVKLVNGQDMEYQRLVQEAKNLVGDKDWGVVSWILDLDTNKNSYAKIIFDKSGVDLTRDKIESEVRIGSSAWGFGSTIDLLVEHMDKTFSIIDFKFGRAFNNATVASIMKFGIQQHQIFESPKEKGKLEIMLRAMMLKTEHPEALFKNLMVQWTPSKGDVHSYQDPSRFVDVNTYIKTIQGSLRDQYNQAKTQQEKDATIYGKLLKLPHFESIFNPKTYMAGYSQQPNAPKVVAEGDSVSKLARYMEELRKNILWDLNPYVTTDTNEKRASIKRARLEQAQLLVKEILELRKTELSNTKWDEDLSTLSLYTGSNRDIDNAYISIYSKVLDQANNKANARFFRVESLYKEYLAPMVKDYNARTGFRPPVVAGQKDRAGFWTNINPVEFWEAAYKYDEKGEKVMELNVTDQDWEQAAIRYPYLRNSEVMRNHRNMVNFIINTQEQFFVNEKAVYNGVAMANRPATWRMKDGVERVISDLELHLNPQPELGGRKKNWQYKKGWFAKVPITRDELAWWAQIPGVQLLSKDYRKNAIQKLTVNHVESELLQERNIDEAIPWRYLGNPEIHAKQEFSKNLEHSFLQFMKYHIMKEERTDVFAFGQGLRQLAKTKQDLRRGRDLSNVDKYLDKAIKVQVQGLRQVDFKGGLLNKDIPIIKTINGNAERPDWVKILRAIKTSSAAPIMLLKPFQGIANFVFISLYTAKEAIKDSIIQVVGKKKFWAIDTDFVSFTTEDLASAWKEYGFFVKDMALGNLHKNKMWALAKKLNYIPDAYDIYTDQGRGSVTRGKLFDQSTLYMFHSAPEEAMAMVIMAAQLKHMKIKSSDAYNGKSLWDMYEMKEVIDPETQQKYFDPVWKDGYVRKYVNTAPLGVAPEYKAITELDDQELRRMKYVYQRMHGGYRHDEKTYLEYFVLGEIFLQFKRYLPTLLRNYGQSRSAIDAYGNYKPVMENGKVVMQDGKEVVEWVSRMVEGRAKVFAGWLLQSLGVRGKVGDNLTLKDKFLTMLGIEGLESYSWANLDESSREILIDFAVTTTIWLSVLGVYLALGGAGGDDEKDPLLKFVKRVQNNIGQQYNAVEAAREVLANGWPSTFKVSWYRIQAISDLTGSLMWLAAGEEDKALTRQETLKGTNRFIKYWMPYGGSYYDFVRLFLNEEYVDEYTFRK